MNRRVVLLTMVALVLVAPVQATIREDFPDLEMAFVGDHVVNGAAGALVQRPFALRLTDASGNPIPGLTVYFQPNYIRGLNPDLVPPLSAYGSFGGQLELAVTTDENGVARSPDFQIGQIGHELIAHVPPTTPENAAVTQGGWGYALFHVNGPHHGPVDPQAPVGGVVSAALPATSLTWMVLLTVALVLAAFAAPRGALGRGNR